MTYDPRSPVLDRNRGMLGRILDVLHERGLRRARRGENIEIARMLGCTPHDVAVIRCELRNGHRWKQRRGRIGRIGGNQIWPQPDSLCARLMALEVACPWLTRREQAAMLGTTPGMVRDTAYRIRKRRPEAVPARSVSTRRAA